MADELVNKANEVFVNEDYQRAVELYSEALQKESERSDILVHRANAYIKLAKYSEAIRDCDAALRLNPKCGKAYLRKGLAVISLQDYQKALETFKEGQKLSDEEENFDKYIQQCEAELNAVKQTKGLLVNKQVSDTPPAVTEDKAAVRPSPMPSGPKTRYDWYQTHSHVVITVLLKNVLPGDVRSNIQEKTLSLTVSLPGESEYSLELDLAHPIFPEQSEIKVLKTKIEIKLKKQEGIQWSKLEDDGVAKPAAKLEAPAQKTATSYPSSCLHSKDWNKLEKEVLEEEKNEKPEGDAALNKLFQQIYANGSDEVKKAMMKSFYESGGTVLSTNWNEIGQQKVEVKPPDGMEYKTWNQ